MDQRTAKTLAEFVNAVDEVRTEWSKDLPPRAFIIPWFRGHSASEYRLAPGLYRDGRGATGTDSNLRSEFESKARPLLAPDTGAPRNRFEWYLTMQHYGLPTRLLDWTEAANTALYFALRESDYVAENEATVWMLEPYKLNEALHAERFDDGLAAWSHARTKRYIPDIGGEDPSRFAGKKPASGHIEDSILDPPVALYTPHTNRRIAAQRGTFTIHGLDRRPLDAYGELDGCLARIDIPASAVQSMRIELAVAGVRESSMFPDLAGLATELAPLAYAAGD